MEQPTFRNFVATFIDLEGVMRAKAVSFPDPRVVPPSLNFATAELYFELHNEERDLELVPDPASVIPIPAWPDWAWVTGSLHLDSAPFQQCARQVLVCMQERYGEDIFTGIECEFTIVDAVQSAEIPKRIHSFYRKSCYSIPLLVRRADFMRDLVSELSQAGLGSIVFHPEAASNQYEVSWSPASPLLTADRHTFVKFYLRLLADRYGLSIDFSPVSTIDGSFNGAHVHCSRQHSQFVDDPSSRFLLAKSILHVAPSLTALINPVENSYKRLNYAHLRNKNVHRISVDRRGGLVRITRGGTIEFRQPDSVASPYLIQVVVLFGCSASQSRCADKSIDQALVDKEDFVALPTNLAFALAQLLADSTAVRAIGLEFITSYVGFKRRRSLSYNCRPTDGDWFDTKTMRS